MLPHGTALYLHQVGDRKLETAGGGDTVFTWLVKQKKAGRIRVTGISGHNKANTFLPLLESRKVNVVMPALNFIDRHTYGFEEKVLPLARKYDVGRRCREARPSREASTPPGCRPSHTDT